ncbi:MAG: NAD dependent epimerase/dehydratase family enzyme [Chloroflexi bacterium AL-W]|nr:NAD dependent epimerase/dehydratase family enzyme [Chloroflexi bacterium AL-N1]NOK65017.1 NAD dependent epimerase/dehydratase family enzyme [Chloroflexi bacterium AL-N10]NOK76787.1 NAD dependent epimerase/dehydratase family enzyme [Chloroflexi bacterium AL-N5]NOK84679.1 NAD dependent epimerase/dehydratase family enzyme [Chloroflexi bacterium AL-W]NOK86497.1 NAD dependent epimerase/dehydratase family enzyme [Chloroflexi bacterium AL-N15]
MRKIVIPGGAGYLGRSLSDYFVGLGYRVVVLSRGAESRWNDVKIVPWDGQTLGTWVHEIDGADAVVNMAGRSVNCRYTVKNRQAIYESRLYSTRVLGEAIRSVQQPPKVWINSSSATIYRHALDRPMDELMGDIGTGFSVDVCRQWEHTLLTSYTPYTRKVAMRTAIVLGRGSGGAMTPLLNIARLGLGGKMGSGTQFVSWLHLEDFVRSVQWLIDHEELDGAINAAAPNPCTNADFMRVLRFVCSQPIGMPSQRWMLEIGAFVLRTETELLLKSRRVVPTRLVASGFTFNYPYVYDALRNIVRE